MLTLGFAVASLLSFSGPEGTIESPPTAEAPPATESPAAEVDAPVIIVTPAPAPAPTLAPAPAPAPSVPDWGPSSSVVISQAAPAPFFVPPPPQATTPRAPMLGIGLYIGSAVAFGVGLGSRVSNVDVAMNRCSDRPTSGHRNMTHCFDHYDSPSMDSNDLMVGAAYGTSIVLGMIASGALGQHKAWQTVHGDGRVRNPVSRYAFGAIFTGLGIAAIGAHYALIYTDAQNPCTSWECNVQRRALWIAASDGGALMLNAGFGLFSWANNYRSNVDKYQKRMQWTVMPGAGRAGAGATATLRF
jgi:hypothetical protein